MTMQADLVALLKARCPRTFTDVADVNTPRPYVTFQLIGGRALQWLDNTAADKRHTMVQIDVWSDSRADGLQLIRQIEADLRAATVFRARPEAEPVCTVVPDITPTRYGASQDFSIYSAR